MRDPDAPAVVHILEDRLYVEEFNTLQDAVRFLMREVPAARRRKAWIATTAGSHIEGEEIVTLAASLGIPWDTEMPARDRP
ncbi:hypothetical protein LB518_09975 [Mesorhizobium sp. BR1-1-16]|uniref:hypothetical protein n=1 Tax=Mesorhizobium sp. BR1-1-16 TaxID=2876653 RepID=UPI001CCDD44B|nr:hypothetical protein [Mesorhizobium sp. BR1-1-16]MBZ9936623.1 hypothetical protein [Mesorhizobium sp. BR1-1-16]